MVDETDESNDCPPVVIEPKVPLAEVLMVVPVAFVNVARASDVSPVAVKVAICKLPVPVALVKVNPCSAETPETLR